MQAATVSGLKATPRLLLQMQGIVKAFPGVVALRGVDLDLRPGEVHVLVGENGAGKSTLIKVLAGLYHADAGTIELEGKPVRLASPGQAQRLGISTIFQEFNLIPKFSIAENIFLGREPVLSGRLRIVDWARMYREAAEALAALGVDIYPKTPVSQLGVALQQMVEIAKALSLKARIIVMDEPTAALSPPEIRQLFGAIRLLKQQGVGIIYISHRLEEVFEIGDRVTVLRDGERVGTVNIKDTTMDQLIRMMVGRDLGEKFVKAGISRGEEVLRVEGLTRKGIFEDVSFNLHRGEILGVAGLVGAGRTELARAIFGADPVDAGRVLIHGQDASIRQPADAIKRGIALLPEDRKQQGLILVQSVRNNITLSILGRLVLPFIRIVRAKREEQIATDYVRRLNIRTPGVHRRVGYLSGGNQQKVVLAKWLAADAEIVIFDEPTRGIDVGAKVEVYQLMSDVLKRGGAVLMISSELPEVLGVSDRILVMRRGRVTGELSREEATQEKILRLAFAEQARPVWNASTENEMEAT